MIDLQHLTSRPIVLLVPSLQNTKQKIILHATKLRCVTDLWGKLKNTGTELIIKWMDIDKEQTNQGTTDTN